jgi:hypothetical protein
MSYELGGLRLKCRQGTSAVSGHQGMSGNPHQRSAKRHGALAQLYTMSHHLPSSILHCLNQRAKLKRPKAEVPSGHLSRIRTSGDVWQGASVVCGDQEISAPWDWVLDDPVVGTFAPALYLLDQDGLIDLSDALRERVRGIYFQVTAAWVRREARLKPLLAQLAQAGIDVIPLKGAALVETHYQHVGLRPMTDIDLLVRPGDFLPAAEVLTAAGLRPGLHSKEGDPFAFKDLPRAYWPLELLFGDDQSLRIDLHQHLIAFHWFKFAFPFTTEALWARRVTDPPGAASPNPDQPDLWGARLSTSDLLAHLCLHPAFHGFRDLKGFLDIDACIRHLPGDWDWSAFMAIAEEWGVRNCAYHAFKFSRIFFDTPCLMGSWMN